MKVNRVEATASLARMLPSAEGDINAGVLPPNLFINNCPNTVGAFSCLERGLTEEGRGGSVMGKLGDWGGGGHVNIGTESNAIFVVPVVNLCLCTIVMKWSDITSLPHMYVHNDYTLDQNALRILQRGSRCARSGFKRQSHV